MEKELNIPTRKDLKEIPTEVEIDAVIIDLLKTTWADITKDPEKKVNLTNPTGEVLIIKYEAGGFIRQDIFPLSSNPTTKSKYGRYIVQYDTKNNPDFKPSVGDKIKVFFDAEGKSDIVLAK